MMPLEAKFRGRTIACLATGPSFSPQQADIARAKGFVLFGCNNIWQDVPDLAVMWATNAAWWDHYWSPHLAQYPAEKWTVSRPAADKYGLSWVEERNAPGLSTDPNVIHHGHGGGFSMLNLAFLMGAARIVLLGYDLKYAPDYDGRLRQTGSEPRHYFGEYPEALLHWPSVAVKNGVHVELLRLYEQVAKQNAVEIINCTGPNSALTCFPRCEIADCDGD
jgi:hypothetical protein